MQVVLCQIPLPNKSQICSQQSPGRISKIQANRSNHKLHIVKSRATKDHNLINNYFFKIKFFKKISRVNTSCR